MLRVGLTGGLGSGKTTAAGYFRNLGAHVLSADEIGRALMQPGQIVYGKIVGCFGPKSVRADGHLDRGALAARVFADPAALQMLNAIVHPAVIAEQEREIERIQEAEPLAVVVVESALIFEVERDNTAPGWTDRFDKLVLVTAPEAVKIARHLARIQSASVLTPEQWAQAEADARKRIALQIPDDEKAARCDFVIENAGTEQALQNRVAQVYAQLTALA